MVPASILAKGERVALDYLLETTALGAFVAREDVRRAIAEDIILEQFKPFVFTALFIDEAPVYSQWKLQRPDAAMLAKRLAENELSGYTSLTEAAYNTRLKLRLSAYRKIDIWWCGREVFTPNEFLGAEPCFNITLPGYEAQPVKIGQTRSALYDSDPKKDAVALELMQKVELLEPIERALFPLLPPEGPSAPREWSDLQEVLAAAEPFKIFSRTHKLPVFPKAIVVDPMAIPEDFVARFTPENELWSSLYALGISPILSSVAVDYLKTKQRAIATLATQRETLLAQIQRSIRFEGQ